MRNMRGQFISYAVVIRIELRWDRPVPSYFKTEIYESV
jgi:hypothetical protein